MAYNAHHMINNCHVEFDSLSRFSLLRCSIECFISYKMGNRVIYKTRSLFKILSVMFLTDSKLWLLYKIDALIISVNGCTIYQNCQILKFRKLSILLCSIKDEHGIKTSWSTIHYLLLVICGRSMSRLCLEML